MPKVARYIPLAGIALDPRAPAPLVNQLCEGLRDAILRRQLRPGTRLPSTRALASELGISRNTATIAYEQLLAEGYLQARIGSGTIVAPSLPDEMPRRSRTDAAIRACSSGGGGTLSKRGRRVSGRPVRPLTVTGTPSPFASGLPDPAAFPVRIWARLASRQWRRPASELLTHGDPAGHLPLREAIAAHIRITRAVECEVEQIVVLSGSQQALDLAGRMVLDPGDGVLVEDPGYPGARAAFRLAGASVFPLPVDSQGADISRMPKCALRSRLAFVTPSHQFPLGVTMTISRRLALLEWARRSGAWIIEDERQTVLVDAAARALHGSLRVEPADRGMHLVGWLPRGVSDVTASDRAKSCGIAVAPLSMCSARPGRNGALLLGYAPFGPDQIIDGVERLARALGSA